VSAAVRVGAKRGHASSVTVRPPSDKAIVQRALVLGALASTPTTIDADGLGDDVRQAVASLRELGVECEVGPRRIAIDGVGVRGLQPDGTTLDAGNSATLARLLAAVLAGQPRGEAVVTGNGALRARPMQWLVRPLRAMGGDVAELGAPGRLPLAVRGRTPLAGIRFAPEVESAQAKAPLLYAGLLAEGETTVVQRFPTRDHTQRLFRHFGVDVHDEGGATTVRAAPRIEGRHVAVPGDVSSAAPLAAVAALLPRNGMALRIEGVGLNPTRCGFVRVLREMGADVTLEELGDVGPEPVGDLVVRPSGELRGTTVEGGELVQSLIDEVPLLCAVAACAEGETRIRGCGELRDKDTDRLATTVGALRPFGVRIEANGDELVVEGDRSQLRAAHVAATGDHRVTMAASALAAVLPGDSVVEGGECVRVSYPAFYRDLALLAEVDRA